MEESTLPRDEKARSVEAKRVIDERGSEGYCRAVELVGVTEADNLLAGNIRREWHKTHDSDPDPENVNEIVAAVRRKCGY